MHPFDQDTAVDPDSPQGAEARIADRWSINGVPNGGYLTAILARALDLHQEGMSLAILTTNFISRCNPGPARVMMEKTGASSQFGRFAVRLLQDGGERMRALGTFFRNTAACPDERREATVPELPPPEDCLQMPAMPDYTLFGNMDVRLDPACAGWTKGHLTKISEQRGWARLREDRPIDALSILLAADAFPPAVLASHGMVAWVPTIELSVNIRAIPEGRWLRGVFRSRFMTCGVVEEDGQLWSESGDLVALSRQIAQYRPT